MKKASRLGGLDALRGIAASIVVFWHLAGHLFDPAPPWARFVGGVQAVWLFFGISGYVIPMTLRRIEHPLQFVKARAARLYPTFIVSVLLTFIIVRLLGDEGSAPRWQDLVANLTMIPHFLGAKYIDPVYWSLEVEWFFYLLMFGVLSLRLQRHLQWVALVMLIPILGQKVLGELGPSGKFLQSHLSVLENLHLFVPGICIYLWNESKSRMSLGLLGFFLLITLRMRGIDGLIVEAGVIALLYLATTGRLRMLENTVLLYLGAISYSLYLTHAAIGHVLTEQLVRLGISPLVATATMFPIVFALATAVTYAVERPSLNWYKRRQEARS